MRGRSRAKVKVRVLVGQERDDANPRWPSLKAGDVYDLPPDRAELLLESGQADLVVKPRRGPVKAMRAA